MVPSEDAKAELSMYQTPKIVTDDPSLFPNVARILDVMLCKIDPANPILVQSLSTMNLNIQVGVLLPKGVAATSKAVKASKKLKKPDQQPSVPEMTEKEFTKPVHKKVEKIAFKDFSH